MKAAEERAGNAPHLVQRILEGGRAASAVLLAVGEENDDLAGQRRPASVAHAGDGSAGDWPRSCPAGGERVSVMFVLPRKRRITTILH
jgi:hypothetical protein